MSKVLIVGAEKSLTYALDTALKKAGFDVVVANNGIEALRAVQLERPDGVVLDPALAWLGGARVRQTPRSGESVHGEPMIVLNFKTNESIRVLPVFSSRDLSEPVMFDVNELSTGVKTLLQRTAYAEGAGKIRSGLIEMDMECWTVSVNDKNIILTAIEFGLLRMLINAAGRVLTRDILREIVWEDWQEQKYDSRTVDVHIGRLRRKLAEAGSYIETVRGVGYRFVAPARRDGRH